jgi:hypothetical protein
MGFHDYRFVLPVEDYAKSVLNPLYALILVFEFCADLVKKNGPAALEFI